MAKKHKFHRVTISPADSEHYQVHHEPKMEEEGKMGGMPMLADDGEKNKKIFHHSDRAGLHAHIDKLMDAHEGTKDSPEEEKSEMPPAMHKLKARR